MHGFTGHYFCFESFLQSIGASLLQCEEVRGGEIDKFYHFCGADFPTCVVEESYSEKNFLLSMLNAVLYVQKPDGYSGA